MGVDHGSGRGSRARGPGPGGRGATGRRRRGRWHVEPGRGPCGGVRAVRRRPGSAGVRNRKRLREEPRAQLRRSGACGGGPGRWEDPTHRRGPGDLRMASLRPSGDGERGTVAQLAATLPQSRGVRLRRRGHRRHAAGPLPEGRAAVQGDRSAAAVFLPQPPSAPVRRRRLEHRRAAPHPHGIERPHLRGRLPDRTGRRPAGREARCVRNRRRLAAGARAPLQPGREGQACGCQGSQPQAGRGLHGALRRPSALRG